MILASIAVVAFLIWGGQMRELAAWRAFQESCRNEAVIGWDSLDFLTKDGRKLLREQLNQRYLIHSDALGVKHKLNHC
jgi:hypothetical protein